MFTTLILAAAVVGQAAHETAPAPSFKAGDRVLIVRPAAPPPRVEAAPVPVRRSTRSVGPADFSDRMRDQILNSAVVEQPAPPPTIAVVRNGRFDRVPNPTRARIIAARVRKSYLVFVEGGPVAETAENASVVEKPSPGQRVVADLGESIEVEIAEGPLKGAKVWTNTARECLKRDVPGNSRSAKRQRAKILKPSSPQSRS